MDVYLVVAVVLRNGLRFRIYDYVDAESKDAALQKFQPNPGDVIVNSNAIKWNNRKVDNATN